MTSTMITLAEAAGTSVASLSAGPADPAGGIIGTLDGLFTSGTDLAKNGITLGILAIGGWTIVKAKMAAAANQVPVGRFGTPQDVARAVMFFADPEASFVTGQTLFVCGGTSVGSILY